jgi:hypothetical protein
MDEELEFIIELCAQHNDLVRARFVSRHSNNKTHTATVQFKIDTEQPISGWYCTCTSGWRDVGCCAHVAALLWHLGVCRAKVDRNIHPLSAGQLFAAIDDSMQFFSDADQSDDEEEDNDDNVASSDTASSTDSDTSTDSDSSIDSDDVTD